MAGRPITCIPSSWSIFAPILYIFCCVLTSRSCQVPHFGHFHFLTPKSLTSVFLYPQQPHVCDDGYHRLIFLKYLPARSILYCTIVKNWDQPTDAIDFDKWWFFIIFLTARSSHMNATQLSVIALESLWWKSLLWSAILRCSLATLALTFSQFFEPVCVL